MFIFSRSARIDDFPTLQVTENMMRYASVPQRFTRESRPRYKYWEYSLAIELARKNNLTEILDVGNGNDNVYDVLCRWHQISLKQARPIDITTHDAVPVRKNTSQMVTIFGELEHVTNLSKFTKKIIKYVRPNGFLLIVTDIDTPDRLKIRTIDSEWLLQFSIDCEEKGFELYNDMQVDYINNNLQLSLVLEKVGTL